MSVLDSNYLTQLGETMTQYARDVLGWSDCPGLEVNRVRSQKNMFRVTVAYTAGVSEKVCRLMDGFTVEAMIRGAFDPTFMVQGLRADWQAAVNRARAVATTKPVHVVTPGQAQMQQQLGYPMDEVSIQQQVVEAYDAEGNRVPLDQVSQNDLLVAVKDNQISQWIRHEELEQRLLGNVITRVDPNLPDDQMLIYNPRQFRWESEGNFREPVPTQRGDTTGGEPVQMGGYWSGAKTLEELQYEARRREERRQYQLGLGRAAEEYRERERLQALEVQKQATLKKEEAEVKPVTAKRRRVKAA